MLHTFDIMKQQLQRSAELIEQLQWKRYNSRIDTRVGGSKPALLLLQLQYWLERKGQVLSSCDGIWYFSSIREWKDNNFSSWSESAIKSALNKLETLGLVESTFPKSNEGNRTKAYSINFNKFNNLLENILEEEGRELSTLQGDLFDTSHDLGIHPDVAINYNRASFLISNIQVNKYSSTLANVIGEKESVMLLQIHHYLTKLGEVKINDRNGLWIYNTIEDWNKQFVSWCGKTIRSTLDELERKKLIMSSKKLKSEGKHVKWYSINFDKFNPLLEEVIATQQKEDKTKQSIMQNKMYFGKLHSSTNKDRVTFSRRGQNYQIEQVKITTSYKDNTKIRTSNNLSTVSSKELDVRNSNPKTSNEVTERKGISNNISLSLKDRTLVTEMVAIWNDIMPDSMRTSCTERRAIHLLGIFNTCFNSSMDEWREYCVAINSSQFLMGEKKRSFRAYFDWISREEQIMRIKNKEFGVGDRVPDYQQKELAIKRKELREATKLQKAKANQQEILESQAQAMYESHKQKILNNISEKEEDQLRSTYELQYRREQAKSRGITESEVSFGFSDIIIRMGYEAYKEQSLVLKRIKIIFYSKAVMW